MCYTFRYNMCLAASASTQDYDCCAHYTFLLWNTKSSDIEMTSQWEREYMELKEAISRFRKSDNSKPLEEQIRVLELQISEFSDDGSIAMKKRKIAELKRDLIARQSTSSASRIISTSAHQTVEQMVESQNLIMYQQDEALDSISDDLHLVQNVGRSINDNVNLQTHLLDEMDIEASGVRDILEVDQRKMKDVSKLSNTRNLRCAILFLSITLLLMILFKV